MTISVDGSPVEIDVVDPRLTLLEVLRGPCAISSVKDGCSPQGQCGCCTVLVDGQPRVACVTPVRRIAGRRVTTLDGLDPGTSARWLSAFTACGASQCGFCTPGIILRLEGLRSRSTTSSTPATVGGGPDGPAAPAAPLPGEDAVERALAAHLCRCTGWRPIIEAWHLATADDRAAADHGSDGRSADQQAARRLADGGMAGRDRVAAEARARLEGGVPQQVGLEVAAGQAGFAADTVPADALVALPTPGGVGGDGADAGDPGSWVVAGTLAEARRRSAKVQGRRTTADGEPPLDAPPGAWAVTLRTAWVDPAYLETDASWCEPGGTPASPLANGGAFGGKTSTPVGSVARR